MIFIFNESLNTRALFYKVWVLAEFNYSVIDTRVWGGFQCRLPQEGNKIAQSE